MPTKIDLQIREKKVILHQLILKEKHVFHQNILDKTKIRSKSQQQKRSASKNK